MQTQFTSISNRGLLLSKTILSLSRIGLVILVISLGISVFLTFYKDFTLSISTRVLLVSVSLIPLFISLYVFFIFENIYPYRSFSISVFLKLLLYIFYLIIPALAIIYRYDGFVSKSLTYINLLLVALFILSPFLKSEKIKIVNIVKDILFSTWSNMPFSINPAYFSINQISNDRQIEYTNLETLKIFQSYFINITNEDKSIAKLINETDFLKQTTIKDILDIGGFDGVFTKKLLDLLNVKESNITLIDPIKEDTYNENVKSVCSNVNYKQNKFEEFVPQSELKFDLIIASHSLYAFLDKNEENIEMVTNQILKLIKPEGLIVILFGSSNNPAYSFKNYTTQYILNLSNNDMCGEKYISYLQKRNDIFFNKIYIDNYIELNNLLSNEDLFSKWVSYFARIPTIKDKYLIKQMKKIALYYSVKSNELPECVDNINRNDDKDYLLHKTIGIIISTTANNVYKSLGEW